MQNEVFGEFVIFFIILSECIHKHCIIEIFLYFVNHSTWYVFTVFYSFDFT